MMKYRTTYLLFIFTALSLQAQDEFNKVYDRGSYAGWGRDVIQTNDKGYAIVGHTWLTDDDIILIKTNDAGDTIFTRTFGGTGWDYGVSLQQTADSGFVIAGATLASLSGEYDVILIKADKNGNTLWIKTFGGEKGDSGNKVLVMQNGDFVILGLTYSYGINYGSVYLIRTDPRGEVLWTKVLGIKSGGIAGWDIIASADGGFLITGDGPDRGVFLMKTNSSGDTTWTQTYNFYTENFSQSVIETPDDGYVMAGYAYSYRQDGGYQSDLLVIKTDLSGDTLWTRTFGSPDYDYGYGVENTKDGAYVITGAVSNLEKYRQEVCLMKINTSGDTVWTRSYDLMGGLGERQEGYSVRNTHDGGFILTGVTASPSRKQQIFLLKVDSLGYSNIKADEDTTTTGHYRFKKPIELKIYPNPATDFINIQHNENTEYFLEITDMFGKSVYQKKVQGNQVLIYVKEYQVGLYLVKLKLKDQIYYTKFLKIRN